MDQEPSAVRQSLIDHGVSVRDWSRAHGFSEALVYAILSGKTKGLRGESYRIAVALGLRTPPSASSEFFDIQVASRLGQQPGVLRGDGLSRSNV